MLNVQFFSFFLFATNTHAGVKTMLGLHFVSKGLITKESGRAFTNKYSSIGIFADGGGIRVKIKSKVFALSALFCIFASAIQE